MMLDLEMWWEGTTEGQHWQHHARPVAQPIPWWELEDDGTWQKGGGDAKQLEL